MYRVDAAAIAATAPPPRLSRRPPSMWQFAAPAQTTDFDPYDTRTLRCLLCITGTRHPRGRRRRQSRPGSLCLFSVWRAVWDVPHLLLSLQGIVLFALGHCDALYFLFNMLIPSAVVVTRHRFRRWHESGRARVALAWAFQNTLAERNHHEVEGEAMLVLPVSAAQLRQADLFWLGTAINVACGAAVWVVLCFFLPQYWIASAAASGLPLELRIALQANEGIAWLSGPFAFASFFTINNGVCASYLHTLQRLTGRTKHLLYSMQAGGDTEVGEARAFVDECLPRHMAMCRSMHRYGEGIHADIVLGLSGVLWLVMISYVNAFLVEPPHQNLWWLARPWATLGIFSFVLLFNMGAMAALSTHTVEYVRVTQICLGTIAGGRNRPAVAEKQKTNDHDGAEGNGAPPPEVAAAAAAAASARWDAIVETARRDLQAFSLVQDLPFIRIMGNVVDAYAVTKFLYLLAVLFVLPLVSQATAPVGGAGAVPAGHSPVADCSCLNTTGQDGL